MKSNDSIDEDYEIDYESAEQAKTDIYNTNSRFNNNRVNKSINNRNINRNAINRLTTSPDHSNSRYNREDNEIRVDSRVNKKVYKKYQGNNEVEEVDSDNDNDNDDKFEEDNPAIAHRNDTKNYSSNGFNRSSNDINNVDLYIRSTRDDFKDKKRTSVILERSKGLGELEVIRTIDIQTDYNSAASQALSAIAASPRLSNRLSREILESPATKRSSFLSDRSENKRKVEGREIMQDHSLYALTYGMMLGIRVLTGRQELYYNEPNNLQSKSPRNQTIYRSNSTNRRRDQSSNSRELTESDFDYELELKFPPEGSFGLGVYDTPKHKLNNPFKFKDYMANVFRVIRNLSGIDEADYMMSIAGDFNYIEFIANSKSGQFFFYSHDGKYMIKTQTKAESKLLRGIMPMYVQHLADNPNTLLVRFYGMHRVKMSFLRSRIYFVVMSSVFSADLPIHVKYDVKGSTIGRYVPQSQCKDGTVQKDLNLLESNRVLRLGAGVVDAFVETIKSDAEFLRQLNIMDYSLLIGIHEAYSTDKGRKYKGVVSSRRISIDQVKSSMNGSMVSSNNLSSIPLFKRYHGGIMSSSTLPDGRPKEIYYFGIIDILQLYNTSKRAETFFKGITGSDTNELSSVNPNLYAGRFISFIQDRTDYDETRKQISRSPSRRRHPNQLIESNRKDHVRTMVLSPRVVKHLQSNHPPEQAMNRQQSRRGDRELDRSLSRSPTRDRESAYRRARSDRNVNSYDSARDLL